MKAMIFAAGLGTRLRPLTNDRPKALVEVAGVPLLEIIIKRLSMAGFDEIMINIHHFGGKVISFLNDHDYFGTNIYLSDERDLLLDTGGGLQKARWFFGDEPFLVHNVDILTDLDLKAFYNHHMNSGATATVAVRNRTSSRQFLFDPSNRLSGWQNVKTGEQRICRPQPDLTPQSFSGIHVISPDLFRFFPDNKRVFSMIDVYLAACGQTTINAYNHDSSNWLDVGTIESLDRAADLLRHLPLE